MSPVLTGLDVQRLNVHFAEIRQVIDLNDKLTDWFCSTCSLSEPDWKSLLPLLPVMLPMISLSSNVLPFLENA